MSVFVLTDCSDSKICSDVLGVFDHVAITDEELASYFGAFVRTSEMLIGFETVGMLWSALFGFAFGFTGIIIGVLMAKGYE